MCEDILNVSATLIRVNLQHVDLEDFCKKIVQKRDPKIESDFLEHVDPIEDGYFVRGDELFKVTNIEVEEFTDLISMEEDEDSSDIYYFSGIFNAGESSLEDVFNDALDGL